MRFVWTLLLAGLLAGCAMNNAQTDARLAAMEERLERLEVDQSDQAIQLAALKDKTPSSTAAAPSVLRNDIEELRGEMNALRQALADVQGQLRAQPAPQAQSVLQRQPESKPVVRPDLNPEDEYAEGRRLYVAQRFEEAAAQFRAFVELFEHHELAPNAQYWLGECYYDREDFLGALDEFQKVIDFYPQSKKAPDAQLKMGLCYRELGKIDQARLELQRVNRMYPEYERKALVDDLLRSL